MTTIHEKKDVDKKAVNKEKVMPDKYLTEMKELPPYFASIEKKEKRDEPKLDKHEIEDIKNLPKEIEKEKINLSEGKSEIPNLEEEDGERESRPFTYKDVILGIVNLVSVIFFVIILISFPKKSQELRELRIKEMRNSTTFTLEASEVEVAKPKADVIDKLFLNESGVVDFVNDLELQKTGDGAISKITFASQKAVIDRTGNFGIPIVIELVGSWQSIDTDLQKIDKLPYLFRPVKVEIEHSEDDPQVVIYKYGIFLYVRESLGQTR